MSDTIQTQIYDSITPLLPTGPTFQVTVDQTFGGKLQLNGPRAVNIQVTGPQTVLTESDIDSVYPAPGSTESTDEFLPHIALKRRTLPWERSGPGGGPWLALLLLKASELTGSTGIRPIGGGVLAGGVGSAVLKRSAAVGAAGTSVGTLGQNLPTAPAAGPTVANSGSVSANVTAAANLSVADKILAVNKDLTLSKYRTPFRPGLTYNRPAQVKGTVGDVKGRDLAGYNAMKATGLADDTPASLLFIRNSAFAAACPRLDESRFLCHARRTATNGNNVDHAVVVGCRLPDASADPPELHTAFLVSLENRGDAYTPDRASNGDKEIGLIVLHSWNFTPSKGGDFEEVMKAIPVRPNGGVLRFGNLPQDVPQGQPAPLSGGFNGLLNTHGNFIDPLPHTQTGNVSYRGPFLPFRAANRSPGFAVRSAPEEFLDGANTALPQDYSYAAAFELGRLLALGNQDVLEDLRAVHAVPPKPTEKDFIQKNLLPIALQKKDWVTNPGYEMNNPWDLVANNGIVAVVKDATQFGAQFAKADVSGVMAQVNQFNAVQTQLGAVGTLANVAVTQLDINTVSNIDLEKTFGGVVIKAQAGG